MSKARLSALWFAWLVLGCNPAPPAGDAGFSSGTEDADPSSDAGTDSSGGDGDGDPSTGDGDGDPSTGDGDGDGVKFDLLDSDMSVDEDCDPDQIPDTLEFTYVKSIPLGVSTLQAGFYDSTRDRVAVFSFFGEGKLLDLDGNILADQPAPPEALPSLDGAAYDLGSDLALFLRQSCDLVEVDPDSFAAVNTIPLGAAHGMSICAGLAIDPLGNLYVASYGTNELVVLDRTGQLEIFRVNLLEFGFGGIDGIAEIAGSDNFLITSSTVNTAAIIDAFGQLVAGPAPIGELPVTGAALMSSPDSMLTICRNGHTWICEEYSSSCLDFAPSDGDKAACDCLVAAG